MIRALVATTLVVGMPTAMPAEDPKAPEFLFAAKGTKREYRLTADSKSTEFTTEAQEPFVRGGRRILRAELRLGTSAWIEEHAVDDKGLYLLSGIGGKYDPPRTVLRFPIKAGDSWTEKYKEGDAETVAKSIVRETETIEVPAGKFRAYPVDTVISAGGVTVTGTTWYAERVGIVKMHLTFAPRPLTTTLELTQFTPGK